jgi:hypothetical protein
VIDRVLSGAAAVAQADTVVSDLVQAALRGGDRAQVTDAPAGAGKTGAVIRLLGELADHGAHVGIITQTNAQAFDLVERAAKSHSKHTIAFMPANKIELPSHVAALPNVKSLTATSISDAPFIVATADKWTYAREHIEGVGKLDAGIVDEAYQMTSAKLLRIAGSVRVPRHGGRPRPARPILHS